MHPVVRMVAIATVPVWIGLTPESAAAQDFNDRWSIIPKAHADPAPEGLEQVKKDEPQAQPATGQDTLKDARTSNRVFPERLPSMRIPRARQRAARYSIGIY